MSTKNRGGCKSWLTFLSILVGTGGSSGRVPSGFDGSMGPFWGRFVEVALPINFFVNIGRDQRFQW